MALKKILNFSELRTLLFWRDVVADGLGTCYLMIFVTFSFVSLDSEKYVAQTPLVGIMVGLAVCLLIEAFRPISGGHFNPCVSLAAAATDRISVIRAIFYTASQCIGSVIGSQLVVGLTPSSYRSEIVAFKPSTELSDIQSVFVEAVFTFNLIFVGLSVSDESHNDKGAMPGFPVGLSVGTAIMSAGTYTGICLNPVVALGTAVAAVDFHKHWVYWVGASVGACSAIAVFKLFIHLKLRHDKITVVPEPTKHTDPADGFMNSTVVQNGVNNKAFEEDRF